jgi:hypothetical protein
VTICAGGPGAPEGCRATFGSPVGVDQRVPPAPLHRRGRLEDVVAGGELVFPVRRLAPDGLEARKAR